jgi:glucan biosynthesis protein C
MSESAVSGTPRKDASIETLRCLALVLMVAGHVIGSDHKGGLCVADDSPFRHFYFSFQLLRLPLFTTISGFVYAIRPVKTWDHVVPCLWGKVRRLLVPMASVGTVEFLIEVIAPGTHHHQALARIWRIYVYGFDHFWFLQAIFTVFVVAILLDVIGTVDSSPGWLLSLAGCCFASLYLPSVAFFSFNGSLYLLPYFVIGVGLARFPWLRAPGLVRPTFAAFLLGVFHQQRLWYTGQAATMTPQSPEALLIGASGMLLAFRFRCTNRWLARLGPFAFPVYLLHIFGTSPGRIAMMRFLHVHCFVLTFFVSLIAGIAVPIGVTLGLRRLPILAEIFLGERAARRGRLPD